MSYKYPQQVKDIPAGKHFAIIKFDSITIPGDERSRTNPGHGYPEYTETTCHMELFSLKEEWEREVERLTKQPYGDWCAAIIEKLSVETKVQIRIG